MQQWLLTTQLPDLIIYTAIGLVTLIGFFKCILPILDTASSLNKAIRSLDEEGTIRVEGWRDELFLGKRLHTTWSKFLRNLGEMEKRGLACPVEDYINTRTVTKIPGNASLSELIPSLLTSLGILGTFIGLTRGLTGLDMKDANTLMNGIPVLLDGMKAAFGTSVAGISCSLVFSMVNRALQGNSYRAIDQFIEDFTRKTRLRALDADVQMICQDRDRNKMLSSVTEGLGSTVEGTVRKVVSEAITPVTQAMDAYVNRATQEQISGLKGIVDAFVAQMNESLGEEFMTLGKTITQVNQRQNVTGEALERSVRAMKSITEDSEKLHHMTQELAGSYGQFVKNLDDKAGADRQFAESSKRLMETMQGNLEMQGEMLQALRASQGELSQLVREYQSTASNLAGSLASAQSAASASMVSASNTIQSAGEKLAGNYERFVSQSSTGLNRSLNALHDTLMEMMGQLNKQTEMTASQQGASIAQLGEIQRLLSRMNGLLERGAADEKEVKA